MALATLSDYQKELAVEQAHNLHLRNRVAALHANEARLGAELKAALDALEAAPQPRDVIGSGGQLRYCEWYHLRRQAALGKDGD